LYWSSKEARNNFSPIGDELDALEAVKNQIELLKEALTSPLDHLTIVDAHGSDATASEMLSEFQSWIIFGKCQLLLLPPRCLSIRIGIESVKKLLKFLDNTECQKQKILVYYAIGI